GFSPLDVSQAVRLDFAGSAGTPLALAAAHLLYAIDLDLGDLGGVVGMAAMLGRVVTMDMTVWSSGDIGYLRTDFADSLPAPGQGARYSAPLVLVDFPQSGQVEPNDALPVWAPIPFLSATVAAGDKQISGQFVLDTGAQLSILSSQLAFALGLDKNGDGD